MLTRILKRAKELTGKGDLLQQPLQYFLQHKVTMDTFDDVTLDLFAQLDDFDIISALKAWQRQGDFILSSLSKMIIIGFIKIKLTSDKVAIEDLQPLKNDLHWKTISVYTGWKRH
jgi:hypothetical protein